MLTVENLNQYYGSSQTLRDLTFEVRAGACTALLGTKQSRRGTFHHDVDRSGNTVLFATTIYSRAMFAQSCHSHRTLNFALLPLGRYHVARAPKDIVPDLASWLKAPSAST